MSVPEAWAWVSEGEESGGVGFGLLGIIGWKEGGCKQYQIPDVAGSALSVFEVTSLLPLPSPQGYMRARARTHTHTHTLTHTHTHTYIYIYIYISLSLFLSVYIYIYTDKHAHAVLP